MKKSLCKQLPVIKSIICFCIIGLILSFSGCGKRHYPQMYGGNADKHSYTVKDMTGKRMYFSQKPRKIVSVGISSDEILLGLVGQDRIAALSHMADDPGFSNIAGQINGIHHRVRKDDSEAILALHPDLVIVPDFMDAALIQTLRDLALSVYQYRTPQSVRDVEAVIREIAGVVGEMEEGEKIIQRMEKRLETLRKTLGHIPEDKQKEILLMRPHGAFFSPKSNFKDICRLAGARDVTQKIRDTRLRKLSQEEIIQLDPDIIFIPQWESAKNQEAGELKQVILSNPSYQNMKAVKNRQVYVVRGREVLAVSQYIVESVETVAKYAYPDKFKFR